MRASLQHGPSLWRGPISGSFICIDMLPQGRPSYFIDMRIVDDEGRELPHDGRAYGDLQVRGPHVVSHYFRVSPPKHDAQ